VPLLSADDADYLLHVLSLTTELRRRLQAFHAGREPLPAEEQDDLRELVEDRLAAAGFEQDGRLTPLGERLTELLELLFTD
jgi:hypothetical protein